MSYQRGHVTVDNNFARFGSKTYAIDKINSVDVRVDQKTSVLWVFFAALAGLVLLLTIVGLSAPSDGPSLPIAILAGPWVVFAVLVGAAIVAYRNQPKPMYHLMLATSSGEVQATTSLNPTAIGELREAIENAMAKQL